MQFEIEIPYTTKPKMRKNLGDLYNKSPKLSYINEKIRQLEKYSDDLHGETFESKINFLVEKSCRHLGLPDTNNIKDFALLFEEDVAIMYNGILSAVCFCFPSSWIPKHKLGLTLEQIHMPVADNANLITASSKLSKTMSDPVLGSFKRQVWTLTTNSNLSNHPNEKCYHSPTELKDLYFRLETQTTEPLGDGITNLFFVKVDVYPLTDLWNTHKSQILASINSMSQNILEYKNLKEIKKFLNNLEYGI